MSSSTKDSDRENSLARYDANDRAKDLLDWKQDNAFVRTFFQAMAHNGTKNSARSNKDKDSSFEGLLSYIFRAEDESNEREDTDEAMLTHLGLYTTRELGSRIKHGATVPVKSFWWDVVVCHLRSFSSNYGRSDFLRLLWKQVLCGIRLHWEQLVPIPRIDFYRCNDNSKAGKNSTLVIDLQFGIVSDLLYCQ